MKNVATVSLPEQSGVGIPSGTEKIVHSLRQLRESRPNCVLVSLDVKNAFNTIHRESFLDGVSQDFPGLLKWASWAYGQPSKLYYKDACITSTNGTKQGEPMGGALSDNRTYVVNRL